jgi:phenylacetate-coenzyme A ligase PaaK-like adenylate-forming protein
LNLSIHMRSLARLTLIPDLVNAIRYARLLKQVGHWMVMTPAELERFQRARLRETVAYAYANVELYRRKWQQAGVGPGDIKTLADLRKLPIITRDDLRHSAAEGILSREFKPHQCW